MSLSLSRFAEAHPVPLRFLRERRRSGTKTYSIELSDVTLDHHESGDTRSHPDPLVESRTSGDEVQKVPESPRPSSPKGPLRKRFYGGKRAATMAVLEPTTSAPKLAAPSRPWRQMLRSATRS